ncbi:MAG: hypothetical protein IBX62_09735 [Coriobacteriia bacterium]|nr:hypothetical protein [Coriobacteriia bacterium]
MRILLTAALLFAALCRPAVAWAVPEVMSPAEVVADSLLLDGRSLTIEGEAIGEALRSDGGRVWVNVLGEGTALGTWTTAESAGGISVYGVYGRVGDRVRVTGRFNAACPRHGGDMDLHTDVFEVVRRGGDVYIPVAWWRFGVGAAGIALASILAWVYRRRSERVPE